MCHAHNLYPHSSASLFPFQYLNLGTENKLSGLIDTQHDFFFKLDKFIFNL